MNPHSFWAVVTYKERVIVPFGFVSFSTRILIVGTDHSERILLQLSCVGADDRGASVKVAVGSNGSIVGVGDEVSVGRGVDVNVAVGGRDVSVGMAACVWAIMVNAAACAVPATSPAFRVGASCPPPQAESRSARIDTNRINFCFMCEFKILFHGLLLDDNFIFEQIDR